MTAPKRLLHRRAREAQAAEGHEAGLFVARGGPARV